MSFLDHMIHLIKECISTVAYQVLINGQLSKIKFPQRGLRQRDPLSPYLFIICANVLSRMLKREVEDKHLHGVRVARNAPTISHIFFSDDSLFFARANTVEAGHILRVLSRY
ncbi:unnamed protein product [Vicia faba]|uniref:Reverse transcriptase domain-containing protein n=1 Tax=Vicia faba TaxID=3906 RepID=A0AAV0ZHU2_VICFA|nr:unnamed protein product [Vicia faba]